MNYDFSKCNNLRWEIEDRKGFCKVYTGCDGKQRIAFLLDGKNYNDWHYVDTDLYTDDSFSIIKIIPRDPRTYTDWQVGDKVKILDNELETVIEVGARINNIVICFNSRGYWGTYTCDELFNMGELVMTDYERTLIQVPKYVFNRGDKVLCRFDKNRNEEEKIWRFGKYYGKNMNDSRPYCVAMDDCGIIEYNGIIGDYGSTYDCCECIPYNENTWHLLGTKEDYNDENANRGK